MRGFHCSYNYYNILKKNFLGEHVQTINIIYHQIVGADLSLNTFIIVFFAQEEGKGRGGTIRKGHERMKACIWDTKCLLILEVISIII